MRVSPQRVNKRPWRNGLLLCSARSGCWLSSLRRLSNRGATTAASSPTLTRVPTSNPTRTCGIQRDRLPDPVNPGTPTVENDDGSNGEIGSASWPKISQAWDQLTFPTTLRKRGIGCLWPFSEPVPKKSRSSSPSKFPPSTSGAHPEMKIRLWRTVLPTASIGSPTKGCLGEASHGTARSFTRSSLKYAFISAMPEISTRGLLCESAGVCAESVGTIPKRNTSNKKQHERMAYSICLCYE